MQTGLTGTHMLARVSFVAALLTAPLALAGCFTTGPGPLLITPKNADYPFRRMTVKGGFEGGDEEVTLEREGDVYVLFDSKGRTGSTSMLKSIDQDLFVVQQQMSKPFSALFLFAIVKRRGNELDQLYCGSYSGEQLARYGVTVEKGNDPVSSIVGGKLCKFTSLDQLLALGRENPAGGEPARKLAIVSLER
jgi:hypothetical protein